MGRMVESLAGEYGCEIAGIVDIDDASKLAEPSTVPREWSSADVAVDFSFPDAVPSNLPALARLGRNVVVGTTGWSAHEERLRKVVSDAGIGVVVAPNFSIGVVLFEAIVSRSAALFAPRDDFGAWIHESHHVLKKDAPSGTALGLQRAMKEAGFTRPIDMASTRAGHNPGSHSVGFDGPRNRLRFHIRPGTGRRSPAVPFSQLDGSSESVVGLPCGMYWVFKNAAIAGLTDCRKQAPHENKLYRRRHRAGHAIYQIRRSR